MPVAVPLPVRFMPDVQPPGSLDQNPISEGGFWSNDPGGWTSGMKRTGSGTATGISAVSTEHNCAYYTGMLTGDQSASALGDSTGGWFGVCTRIQGSSDGS